VVNPTPRRLHSRERDPVPIVQDCVQFFVSSISLLFPSALFVVRLFFGIARRDPSLMPVRVANLLRLKATSTMLHDVCDEVV
jgi:hypothetical protein